jgi:hypothetical protein
VAALVLRQAEAAARLASAGAAELISGQRKRLEGVAAALEKALAERLREAGVLLGERGG